jgi:hypothetical protein
LQSSIPLGPERHSGVFFVPQWPHTGFSTMPLGPRALRLLPPGVAALRLTLRERHGQPEATHEQLAVSRLGPRPSRRRVFLVFVLLVQVLFLRARGLGRLQLTHQLGRVHLPRRAAPPRPRVA